MEKWEFSCDECTNLRDSTLGEGTRQQKFCISRKFFTRKKPRGVRLVLIEREKLKVT